MYEHAFDAANGGPRQASILIGARSTGKTALLSRIGSTALERGWIKADATAAPGMLNEILVQTTRAAKEFVGSIGGARLTSLSIGPVDAEWQRANESPSSWRTCMADPIEQLNERDIGLLITVDEVSVDLDEMIQLAAAYQHFVRENRRVALAMAGLPQNVSGLISHKYVSFLRRCEQIPLDPISSSDISTALQATVANAGKAIDFDALELCAKSAKGFPNKMQLVGFYAWGCSPVVLAFRNYRF